MKTIPAALLAVMQSQTPTIAHALKITRLDGQIFGYTSHDKDVTISGVTYRASPGLSVTNVVTTAGGAVGNLELSTLNDGTTFSTIEVLSGLWRDAAFTLFRYDHAIPANGVDTLLVGVVGNATVSRDSVVVELRDIRQYLQQPVGSASSPTCRYRLGDAKCGVNLAGQNNASPPYDLTTTGTLTAVTDNQTFEDGSLAGWPDDWFGNGVLTWISGNNNSLSGMVRSYDGATGGLVLVLPMIGTVQVGDTFSIVAGCRKRLTEDCIAKFGNVLNFGGEPHRPLLDDINQTPDVNV